MLTAKRIKYNRDKLVSIQLPRHEGSNRGKDGIHWSYQDTEGWWTAAYGRLIDPRKGGRITDFERSWLEETGNGPADPKAPMEKYSVTEDGAQFLLRQDVIRFEKELDKRLPWWRAVEDVRARVLIDMAFNMGVSGLLQFKNTLDMITRSDFKGAGDGMMNSKWARQTKSRAVTLAEMMRSGKDPDWLKGK